VPIDGRSLIRKFFPGTGKSYDSVVRWTTLGLDGRWKRRVLEKLPEAPNAVLELAAGTGILTSMLLDRFPQATITGVDITDDYLEVAKRKVAERGAEGRVTFLLGNAESVALPPAAFDACVSCYVPKYCDLDALGRNVDRALRPGGTVVLHDFGHPRGAIPRLVWRAWFGLLNFFAPKIWPEWRTTFDRDLTSLIESSTWAKRARAAFAALGYEAIDREHLTFRSATIVTARKPGGR
jgi:demethylmenaquinone methyltransferase/2-methoxy-6-polyprenyl-1,4-benzoquinol methylase